MMRRIPGKFLVKSGSNGRGDQNSSTGVFSHEILFSNVGLSLWGGIDPVSGIVIDQTHPLYGKDVKDTILCLPSGRGSCTASQVLLELILNDRAPAGIVLRDVDGLISVGALVAQEFFDTHKLDIVQIGEEGYDILRSSMAQHGRILRDGSVVLSSDSSISVPAEDTTIAGTSSEIDSPLLYSDEEQNLLDNASSEAQSLALRVIFQYAHILNDNPTYIPVTKAHIDGCTYIGPGGLQFARKIVETGGKVVIPTTLNSMSTDRTRWHHLGVPEQYATNAIALGDAYLDLGCMHTFTCAPYLLKNPPSLGENIVWGESNAVVFANSVLGGRTEKYADYLDILCACTGIVPAEGVHLDANRKPNILLDASELSDELRRQESVDFDVVFPVLGHLCGTKSDGKVPLLTGLQCFRDEISRDHLKSFCAAFGTTASSPLVHIEGITAEACNDSVVAEWKKRDLPVCTLSLDDMSQTFEILDSEKSENGPISLIALGNPHLSVSECRDLAGVIQEMSMKKNDHVRVVACISNEVMKEARDAGFIEALEEFGVEFVNDTCWCMLLDPPVIPENTNAQIMTNSGKYAHYGPGLTQRRFRFGSTTDCLVAATTGKYAKFTGRTSWLSRTSTSVNASQKRTLHSLLRAVSRFSR